MKVLLIGNYAPDAQESMQRFSAVLEFELRARGHTVCLLRPRARLNRRGAPPFGRAKWLGYFDKFVLFPGLLRRAARRADVVHICDHSNAIYALHLRGSNVLVTCNDVLAIRSARGLVPHHPTGPTGKILQWLILRGLNRVPRVACISDNTRAQLLEVSTRAPATTSVIEMGQNYSYSPLPTARADALINGYFGGESAFGSDAAPEFLLHVGGNQWYKNREGVLQIYRALRRQMGEAAPLLVMAGLEWTPAMRLYCAEHDLGDVISVVGASNPELCALYSRARALLFPSLAEGFGWPIIEAQSCGCPVITTDLPPMNAIGGAAAVLCDPLDTEAAAAAVRAVVEENPDARAARVEAGLRNAARFTTARMIESYERLYAQIARAHTV